MVNLNDEIVEELRNENEKLKETVERFQEKCLESDLEIKNLYKKVIGLMEKRIERLEGDLMVRNHDALNNVPLF